MILSLWRTVWRFLKKIKIELSYGPAIPVLGIYLEIFSKLFYKSIENFS